MDERTRHNLIDAGCPELLVCEYERLSDADARKRCLRAYRCELLEGIHAEQRKLDCLDYLIFSLRNQERE